MKGTEMEIVIALFDRFTALDAVGPYEVLSRLPGANVTFVAERAGVQRTDAGRLGLAADCPFADAPRADIVLVPGGTGTSELIDHAPTLDWIRAAHADSTWTTSVCTGSLLLAAAGLLEGKRATSHWLALEELRALGAEPIAERFVFDGKIVTAAGVSAGIDMALELAGRIAGEDVAQSIQLSIEYDPAPPWDAGSPAKAPAAVVQALRARSRFAGAQLATRAAPLLQHQQECAQRGGRDPCRHEQQGRAH